MSASTVFVNGSSGFNATWEIQTLLQKGHQVVATVHSRSKAEFLQSLFAPAYGARFSVLLKHSHRRRESSETSSSDETSTPANSTPSSPSFTATLPSNVSPQSASISLPQPTRTSKGGDMWFNSPLRLTPLA
ncbi:hypothetical protein DL93DRAFT_2097057 [Clavulina sp. PMI_390]|nr:hypothetical protein DL93DRAFT_2097057 [Clavulina sp. PMI_390]